MLQDRYINPLTDFGFKRLFGSEPNKDLLIDFLNQLLPERHKIEELNYAQNEQMGFTPLDRKAIFDLYCKSPTGEHFIVELQKAEQKFFKDRSVYYSSFPIQDQALKGEWNYRLQPVYTVGILNFTFEDHRDSEELVHTIELKDQNCEVFYDKLKFIYIELPKFKKTDKELDTHFDKWLYVFRYLSKLQDRPQALQDRVFKKLFEAAEIATFSPIERKSYEDSLKYYRDLKNVIDTSAEKGFEKGMKRGIEKGIEKGIEQRNKNIAAQMKISDEPLDKIILYTGLSREEIENL